MPFISRDKMIERERVPGMLSTNLVGKDHGGVSLMMTRAMLRPGAEVDVHTHSNCEEAVYVLEGSIEGLLGDETRALTEGDVMLVPAGVKHTIMNRSSQVARVVQVVPTIAPNRTSV